MALVSLVIHICCTLTKKLCFVKQAERNSRVTYQRKSEPPSIPTPGQAYGYQEGEDGSLQRQKPPHKDKTLGPAYYQVLDVCSQSAAGFLSVKFTNSSEIDCID